MEDNKTPINDLYYDRLHLFLQSSNSETDRGRALVASSLIEEMLEEILKNFLLDNKETRNLFESAHAPLSTFSAKTLLCKSLGLISKKEYRDIDIIRRIRNEFAHSIMASFEQKKIYDLASSLQVGMSALDALPKKHKSRVDEPRGRFTLVSTSLVTQLYNRAHYVERIRIKETSYPA